MACGRCWHVLTKWANAPDTYQNHSSWIPSNRQGGLTATRTQSRSLRARRSERNANYRLLPPVNSRMRNRQRRSFDDCRNCRRAEKDALAFRIMTLARLPIPPLRQSVGNQQCKRAPRISSIGAVLPRNLRFAAGPHTGRLRLPVAHGNRVQSILPAVYGPCCGGGGIRPRPRIGGGP
jgi:hypothetical protein